jgi:hypothetical protein
MTKMGTPGPLNPPLLPPPNTGVVALAVGLQRRRDSQLALALVLNIHEPRLVLRRDAALIVLQQDNIGRAHGDWVE